MGIGEIGKANRRKGQRPFFKTSEASASELLSRRVKLGFRRWLWAWDAMACVLKVRTHCGTRPKRRIKPDFTRPAGVDGSGVANPAVGGKTPCLKIPAQNCHAILLTIYREEMRDRFLRPSRSPSAYNSRSRDASLSSLPTVSGFSGRIITARPSRSNCSARASALL